VAPAVLAAEALDDPAVDEPLAGEEAVSLPAGELPRGRLSGRFLHGVLEELPLETLADAPALAVWSARPAVAAVFERMRRRHERRADHLPHARRLVHTALTAAVRLGETSIPGLGTVTPALREMEFLFPIPERAHPLLEVHRSSDDAGTVVAGGGAAEGSAATDALPFRIERGLVKGYVDLLFEHQGRGYVCDWKSDWLPSYGEADLAIHSRHHYAVQAQIYTVAALRLLGVGGEREYERRFGGVVYGYLRGMNGGDDRAGLYFHRPAWREILAWQAEMLGERYWRLG
jgi:exodeoxyribonuclease V beta subunit